VPDAFKNDPMMFKLAQDARRATDKKFAIAETKKEVKGEFDAEVQDAASTTLDFDVKTSAQAGGTAK